MARSMIIGISGKARHGKNTLGMFLAMHLYAWNVEAKCIAFADALKDTARLLGWDGQKDAVGRFALQEFGKLMRNVDNRYWIDILARRHGLNALNGIRRVYIITDVRYRNEAKWVRSFGSNGLLIRVRKVDNYGTLIPTDDHPSETELDDWTDWDFVVSAMEGDLDTLWKEAGRIAKKIV